jgi:2-methylisocitrate lyase-like PEP mutase family enzyme
VTLPLERPSGGAEALRSLLDADTVFAGSCYDCLSAVILEEAGYPCLTISGAGVAASLLGVPDIGLVTHTEMVEVARRVARRVRIPVIADIDTGFGNALNVMRTVDEFVAAGVAAVHIEDQVFPKRCGHISGKDVVDSDEFIEKIRAAARAREGSELVLIARTDAIAVHGIDDAIERARAALDAGADVAFVEAPTSMEQIEAIATAVPGHKLFNLATGGRSPSVPVDELAALGFNLVIVPTVALYAAVDAMRRAARDVLEARSDAPLQPLGLSPLDLFELVGMRDWSIVAEACSGSR